MTSFLRKFWAVVRIYVCECFAYPAASMIWVLADVQAALILPAVWLATSSPGGLAGGMERSHLVAYYLVSMTLAQVVICHLLWDIGFDIKEGFFSPQLLRPLGYFKVCTARNLAWRLSKLALFLPVLPLVALAYGGFHGIRFHFGWEFWVAAILAHILSFLAAYSIAMIALWTTEYMSLFRLYYVPEMFLSGRLVPASALPKWAQTLSDYTHFPYMISFPTRILLGEVDRASTLRGFAVQLAWCLCFMGIGFVLFRRGVRQYAGVGT